MNLVIYKVLETGAVRVPLKVPKKLASCVTARTQKLDADQKPRATQIGFLFPAM
jgi:hypothetical protein